MIDTTLQEQKLLGQGQGIPSVDAYIRANPATGSPNINPNINLDNTSLSANDIGKVRPLNISPQNAGTASNALIGSTDATLEQAINQQKTSAEQATTDSKQTLENTLNQYLGVQQSRGQVESQLNIPELGKLSNETFSSLQASKRAQERELKAIMEQPGMTREQSQGFIEGINRKYAFEQADLAIAYDVANRNLSSAQATADRKIQLQLEPLKTLLDFQTTFYEDNKADLSKAQQNQLQSLITKNTREYETTQTNLKYLRDVKMKYMEGVIDGKISPSAVTAIQNAKTPEDVIGVASRYTTSKVDINAPTVKSINGVDMQWNPITKKWETISNGNLDAGGNTESDALKVQLADLNSLITTGSYKKVVGVLPFGATPSLSTFTGEAQRAQGEIKQVISQNTLNTLINLKKQGGTLGALSDTERVMLQNAATKIGSWEKKNIFGQPTGNYNVSEADFLKELNVIKDLTQKALRRADPLYNVSEGDLNIINNLYGGMQTSTAPFNPANYY